MSKDMIYEDVPRFIRRTGDMVLANENNSTIILGRDRQRGVETGHGNSAGAGSIHMVVGRQGEDPDPVADDATLYISRKSDPDSFADVEGVGKPRSAKEKSSIVCRADCIRSVAREDYKLVVGRAYISVQSDGHIVIEGDISLGAGAAEKILRESFARDIYPTHTHLSASPGTPTGIVMQPVPPSVYNDRVKC